MGIPSIYSVNKTIWGWDKRHRKALKAGASYNRLILDRDKIDIFEK